MIKGSNFLSVGLSLAPPHDDKHGTSHSTSIFSQLSPPCLHRELVYPSQQLQQSPEVPPWLGLKCTLTAGCGPDWPGLSWYLLLELGEGHLLLALGLGVGEGRSSGGNRGLFQGQVRPPFCAHLPP